MTDLSSNSNQAHPDLSELDALRAGEGTAEFKAHLRSCAECRAAVGELQHLATSVRQMSVGFEAGHTREADHRVLSFIAARSAEIRTSNRPEPRTVLVLFPRWAWAAAAVVALAVGMWSLTRRNEPLPTAPITATRGAVLGTEDIDRNGTVDIVDAYLMARRMRSGEAVPQQWDFNHDGRVDEQDVNLVARDSVALGKGGS